MRPALKIKDFLNELLKMLYSCEVDAIAVKSYLRGVSAATSAFAESTSMFLVILTYVLLGNVLEASIVYSVAQYFGMIKTMMTVFFPRAISSAAEARVSIERVQVGCLRIFLSPKKMLECSVCRIFYFWMKLRKMVKQ